ncbi:MAG: 30S ribosomal protein S16 [Candidatus Doudnabacteria bacterium]|nr:30S ribosomal protein S16 [Candidatus Doudnabacteria bacterium]
MLTIRLQRTGTKNRPTFRIVLAEAHRSASKKFLEVLGHYNPRSKDFGIKDQDRLKFWLAKNIQLSPTVHNLFVDKQFITSKKVKAWKPKKKDEPAQASPAPAASAEAKTEPSPTPTAS